MKELEGKLYHALEAFERQALEQRMAKYGFKNIKRIELFLWDLEIFLQIQNVLRDRVVLKGGAAVQFYLPINAQRTSVDIDMIFNGTREELEDALKQVTKNLESNDNPFVFELHTPKKPKTQLQLFTYFIKVPTVLNEKELCMEVAVQELKVEFILDADRIEISKRCGRELFAICSEMEYNLMPLNNLFADKLTTLGPNTIGVQNERMDEQVKQIYDIWMLINHHINKLDIQIVREKYFRRAELECASRRVPFDPEGIKGDVYRQLHRFSQVDTGNDGTLVKYIRDFKSLYLKSDIRFNPADVACAAELIKLTFQAIFNGDKDFSTVKIALEIRADLDLSKYKGIEKGEKSKELRDRLIEEFIKHSTLDAKLLKGKALQRVFWSIIDTENIYDVEKSVKENLG